MMGQVGQFAEHGRTVLNFDRQNCVQVGMTLIPYRTTTWQFSGSA